MMTGLILCSFSSLAESAFSLSELKNKDIPVWIHSSEGYDIFRDAKGHYQGFYPLLIDEINKKYGLRLTLIPTDNQALRNQFADNDWGVFTGVERTNQRASTRLLSTPLFSTPIVAVSLGGQVYRADDLNNTRVAFNSHDATVQAIASRFPGLHFRSITHVQSSDEAWTLLNTDKIDFYINDIAEINNLHHPFIISQPFQGLTVTYVMAFSPELIHLQPLINQFLSDAHQSRHMDTMIESSKRQYMVSKLKVTPQEQDWINNNVLQVWLPGQENFAPFIWREGNGYRGSVINMIADLRDLLHMRIDVHYIDNYVQHLRQNQWPVRLVNIENINKSQTSLGLITASVPYRNIYYNAIGSHFLWEENLLQHHRVGVIKGSFSHLYLLENFGKDLDIKTSDNMDELIADIEDRKVDYILGDLSSLETSLRGDEVFRRVLKVAGIASSDYVINSWVTPQHPLHDLLRKMSIISRYRAQIEQPDNARHLPILMPNSWKIIAVILFLAAIFSGLIGLLMWRHLQQNRLVNRRIVIAMEQVNRAHDDETGSHILRVAQYCGLMARLLKLPKKMIRDMENYASLHDIGKIAVPERILRKQGPLTAAEFAEMKLHTIKGWQIIRELQFGSVPENIIHCHHERWDGSGYPQGLSCQDIPLEARILAIADVYDALRQKRIYKPSFPHEKACEIIREGSGSHFDPALVRLFLAHQDKFRVIYDSHVD